MRFTAFDYAMWLAGAVLHLTILTVMAKRKLIHELPVFSAFVMWSLVSSGVVFVLLETGGYAPYFYGYWMKEGVLNALIFGVVYEIYDHAFRNYKALQRLGVLLFWWAGILLLGIAIVMAISAPGTDLNRMMSGIVTMERSVRVIQVGLLLFIILLKSYFKLSWRTCVLGLTLGFGVYAGLELLAVTFRAHLGETVNALWGKASVIAYMVGAIVWMKYLSVTDSTVVEFRGPQKAELERWNQALAQLLYR